mmetsp:Transcript_25406/g.59110  ORF Transcript_25406/g.59110 Transcript_25406/m.59110 type:complete len:1414 (+) Transcript_25406:10-4251(+)
MSWGPRVASAKPNIPTFSSSSGLRQPLLAPSASERDEDGLASVALEGSHVLLGRPAQITTHPALVPSAARPQLMHPGNRCMLPMPVAQPACDDEDDMDSAVVADERSEPGGPSSCGSSPASAARVPAAFVRQPLCHPGLAAKAPRSITLDPSSSPHSIGRDVGNTPTIHQASPSPIRVGAEEADDEDGDMFGEGSIFSSDESDDELFERMEPVYRKISAMVERFEGSVPFPEDHRSSASSAARLPAAAAAAPRGSAASTSSAEGTPDRIGAEALPMSPPKTAPRAPALTTRLGKPKVSPGEAPSPGAAASSSSGPMQGPSPGVDTMSAAIQAVRSGLEEICSQVTKSEKISRTITAISGDKILPLSDGLKEYWGISSEGDGTGQDSHASPGRSPTGDSAKVVEVLPATLARRRGVKPALAAIPDRDPEQRQGSPNSGGVKTLTVRQALGRQVQQVQQVQEEEEEEDSDGGLPKTLQPAASGLPKALEPAAGGGPAPGAKGVEPATYEDFYEEVSPWKDFELPDSTLQGLVWKRRAYLSRAAKVTRLIRKEAQNLISDKQDWLSGLGNIQLEKVAGIAKALMSAVGEPRKKALTDGGHELDEHFKEKFDRRFLCLRNGALMWAKLPEKHDISYSRGGMESLSLSPMRRIGSIVHSPQGVSQRYVTAVEPLYGGSAEYVGSQRGMHIVRVFLPHQVMRETLTFAMDSQPEAEKWVQVLRHAAQFPLPKPVPHRPCCSCFGKAAKDGTTRCGDFINARGPPEGEEPAFATIELEIISATGLGLPEGVLRNRPGAFSPYVLGRLGRNEFRTPTRYQAGSHAVFDERYVLPVEEEGADELIHLEVYHEPEFEDHEPLLLGAITVPLFTCERNKRLYKVVQLTQTSITRQGYVNASFGHLAIAVKFRQPIGHLWLPVEPALEIGGATGSSSTTVASKKKSVDMADLELQISRFDALLQLIIGWQTNIAFMLQWERSRFSLAWLIFLEVWMLFAWAYSLSIMCFLVIYWSYQWRPSLVHQAVVKVIDGLANTATRNAGDDSSLFEAEGKDKIVWEAERRIVLAGFSAEYLHDFETQQWTDEAGEICAGPQLVVLEEDGRAARYHWKVVVNDMTDENGWQYASGFGSTHWMRSFDTFSSWVRRRQHYGKLVAYLEGDVPDLEHGNSSHLSEEEVRTRSRTISNAADVGSIAFGAAQKAASSELLDLMPSENNQLKRWIRLYVSIRDVIDFWLVLLEKHKNLFTWKDKTVTKVVVTLVFVLALLALVVPTHFIFAFLIGLAFYIGYLMGEGKRKNRAIFLDALGDWCRSLCAEELVLKSTDACTVLEERGITRLALRNWCNTTYSVGLDLRTVDSCQVLTELADMVIFASEKFEKAPRRYRAWHSDIYNNFFDHVPSDVSEHDPGSACYRMQASSSLPPLLS